ncbi:hypothetical protein GCM10028864_56920 [Microlunatus parietis]
MIIVSTAVTFMAKIDFGGSGYVVVTPQFSTVTDPAADGRLAGAAGAAHPATITTNANTMINNRCRAMRTPLRTDVCSATLQHVEPWFVEDPGQFRTGH